jgi:UrcA family protein
MNRSFASLALGLSAATALAAAAAAQPLDAYDGAYGGGTLSRTVHLGDLDLGSAAGARVAATRIRLAADYVCGGDLLLGRMSDDFIPCRHAAIDRALASLHAPLVSAALGRATPTSMAER